MDNTKRDAFIAEKLNEGVSLSDVQKMLKEELGINITYFDLRMISSELAVDWKKQDPVVEAEEDDEEEKEVEEAPSQTLVEVSKIVRPGAAMSGSVHFKSGIKAEWYLDNYGRLGLEPENEGDQPTEEDLQEFQVELQKAFGGA